MELREHTKDWRTAAVLLAACLCALAVLSIPSQPYAAGWSQDWANRQSSPNAQNELQLGIDLTRQGKFAEAIPHFLAARGHVGDGYAANFNLALCYVGTAQFSEAIRVLGELRSSGRDDANVENLLAQAFVGNNQSDEGLEALQRAAALSPKNEKLYLLVADACGDRQNYELGLRVIDLGLRHIPDSPRLHYQRGYFLTMLDRFDSGKPEFDRAAALAPGTEIAYLAAAQKCYFAGDMSCAVAAARSAAQQDREDYLLLTILGDALVRGGAAPGEPSFQEAKAALEKAVAERPGYVTAQIAVGNLLVAENHIPSAIEHLEQARKLNPRNPSVYSHLAVAYRKLGRTQDAEAMLAILAKLNSEEAARIHSAPGERKAIP